MSCPHGHFRQEPPFDVEGFLAPDAEAFRHPLLKIETLGAFVNIGHQSDFFEAGQKA